MKIQHIRRPSGFTLVELLVVIVIIAVLASAGLAVGNRVMLSAKNVKALSIATGIEQAVNNFVRDTGTYPKNGIESDEKIGTNDKSQNFSQEFLDTLLALEKSESPLNAKGIKYLDIPEGKANKDGLIYEQGGGESANAQVRGIYDPWGGPFLVQFDGDYDDQITVKTGVDRNSKVVRGRKVVVWSNGPNNTTDQSNSKSGKPTDAVKTWK
ncbi:MAG: type II secretion system protein [Akkermansiaceae bacterium]|nr:type II secretion system protein [Akkermansiaceae bacterium]